MIDHLIFSLNVALPCMTSKKGKFLVWSEYMFGIYQSSRGSLLELQQNNLSNPEPELCQKSEMECFAKIISG